MNEKQAYVKLKERMEIYSRDYSGFISRSDRIEEREYLAQGREEEDVEILNSYGVI